MTVHDQITLPTEVAKQTLRQQMRQHRKALSPQQQQIAAQQVNAHFVHSDEFKTHQRIALFLSHDGELDTRPLIESCWQAGKEVFLPVLHPFCPGYLLFLAYRPDSVMTQNKYKIAEPVLDVRDVCPPAKLDLILLPLVAFDHSGNRLGMGGGFYDRTLARLNPTTSNKPSLIGVAHDFQKVDSLPCESWDVPLNKVITPTAIIPSP